MFAIFKARPEEIAIFDRNNTTVDAIQNLMFDLVNGRTIYNDNGDVVAKSEAEKSLLNFSRDFCGFDAYPAKISHRDMKRAFNEGKIQRWFEIVETVVDESLDTGYRESEWFNQLVDYRNLALGDAEKFFVEDDNVLLNVATVGKSHHDYILQRLAAGTEYTVPMFRYGAAVGIDLNRYFAGQESIDRLVAALTKSIMVKNQGLIAGALADAVTKIPVSDGFVGTGALVKADFDEIIDNVAALYGAAVVLGTKSALRKVTALNADGSTWSEGMKADIAAMGRLGSYEGTTLVEIPQRFADKSLKTKLMDDKKLYILPSADYKIIDFVTRGETEIDQIMDKGEANGRIDDIGKYELQYENGVAVKANKQFGVWTLA